NDEFGAKALIHNLSASDYGRPLNELRDLWWSSPRLPLLPGGDVDLQRAIFEAVKDGKVRVVGDDGTERAVTRPGDIAVGSAALRLEQSRVGRPTESSARPGFESESGETQQGPRHGEVTAQPRTVPTGSIREVHVS